MLEIVGPTKSLVVQMETWWMLLLLYFYFRQAVDTIFVIGAMILLIIFIRAGAIMAQVPALPFSCTLKASICTD